LAGKALILGGYGAAGRAIARLLLRETSLDVTLAGRDAKQASAAAAELGVGLGPDRVGAAQVDANDAVSLGTGLEGCDLIIVCIPLEGIAHSVAQTAIQAGVDWIDISLGLQKAAVLRDLGPTIERSGCRFITEAGALPGLPATLVRLAADELGDLQAANVSGFIKGPELALGSSVDLLRLVATPAMEYSDGEWRKAKLMATRSVEFGDPFGTLQCYPMDLVELRELPEQLDVKHLSAHSAGVNPVIDLFVLLFKLLGLGRSESAIYRCARLLMKANRRFTKPPYTVRIKLEAEGCVDGAQRRLELLVGHEDGYEITAIPLVACVLQLLDGSIRLPGLRHMGSAVDPHRLLADTKRLGARVDGI
jgi:saccharopine dehydrogenase (NAD+, L-lysine-forming)